MVRPVSWSLGYLCSQFHVVVRQAKLQEIIVVNIAVHVLVEGQEKRIHVSFLDVVDMILPQKSTKFSRADGIVLDVTRFES